LTLIAKQIKVLWFIYAVVWLGIIFPSGKSFGQELEPRLLTNVPVGMNFVLGGYAYGSGDLLLDPSLSVKDLNGKVHSFFAAYVRTINLLGKSGKLDVIVPYASGNWTGVVAGIDSSRSQSGLGDIRARFSFNLTGAPAISVAELGDYEQKMITGASIQVILPTGAYENIRVINLGTNRITLRGCLDHLKS